MAIGFDSNGQSEIPAGGSGGASQTLTTTDALDHLRQVKHVFYNRSGIYDRYIELMKDFKAQRIDKECVIAAVKVLFKGHNNLISGFNRFLPEDDRIPLEEEDETLPPKQTVEVKEAASFVNKTEEENMECSICLGKLRAGFTELECSHRFHAKCFRTWWSKYNPTCPYCRLRVNQNGEKDP